jgi:hypothetical protein
VSNSTEERIALDYAAEEYAYNPDTPMRQSGIRGETSVDPEEAFKAGARWALTRTDNDVSGLVEALEPFAARLQVLESNCHRLKCGVPRETNVLTGWLRTATAALAKHRQSNGGTK